MTKLDSAKLDSSAKAAEIRGVARGEAADRASAGPGLVVVVHDVPDRPLEIAIYRGRNLVSKRRITPHHAMVMAEQLLAGVRLRLERPGEPEGSIEIRVDAGVPEFAP